MRVSCSILFMIKSWRGEKSKWGSSDGERGVMQLQNISRQFGDL